MKKLTILLTSLGLMLAVNLPNLFIGTVFAQTATDTTISNIQAVQNAETVTTGDLGVSDPGLLPTNPFYFLKEFGRNFQRVFTFNSLSKAELELKITNEKAAEVKKIQEIAPNDNNAIVKGLENYKNAQENLKNRLESLNISSTTPGVGKLMNSIAVDSVLHQKVLDEIGSKASDSVEVKNIIDLTRERIDDSIIVAAKENPINFTTSLENAFIDSKGSEFKYIRSLEIIDRLENKIPEEARASLNRLRENFSDQLNENIKATIQSSNSEVVQRALLEMPGDAIRKAVIINDLKARAASGTISTLEGVSRDLEKEYSNEQDLAKKAEEQLRLVKELMKKLEERMSQVNNGVDIRSNVEVAKDHIQRAETAFSDKKYGEVIGQSRSVEAIIRKSLSLFEEKSVNLEDLNRQVKELYSKINSYSEMLNARKITADSNPRAYEALSNAKVHAGEAEKFIGQNSIIEAKKHISEARMSLESIFKLIEQNTTNRVITPTSIVKPVERAININDQATTIKKDQSISNCEALKKYPAELETMRKEGRISEKDYSLKLETIKKELDRCSSQSASTETLKPAVQMYCTQEAKLCSDGSYVGRTGPNCEFAKCPGEGDGSNTDIRSFNAAYWQCYDGAESKDSSSCKTSDAWRADAKKFCDGHCYADKSKCGVNSFSVLGECGAVPSATSVGSGGSSVKCLRYDPVCGSDGKTYACGEADAQASNVKIVYRGECAKTTTSISNIETTIKEECGKENEKVNRDPLAGPITKQCCYGLKEDRASKYYSMCIKPLENTAVIDKANTQPASSGVANPASIFCVSKGYKNIIKSNADGGQYGVCIFNDGSECDEWKYYRGECGASGSLNQVPPTSTLPTSNTTINTTSGSVSGVNTIITNTTTACPVLAPISPSAEKECNEKGGKLISERNSTGCYLTPRCVLSATSSAVPTTQ